MTNASEPTSESGRVAREAASRAGATPRPGAHVVAGGTRFRVPAAAEEVSIVLLGPGERRDVRPLARVRPGLHEAVLG
nr:hypothetical protein [Myxococcota bacterium]